MCQRVINFLVGPRRSTVTDATLHANNDKFRCEITCSFQSL